MDSAQRIIGDKCSHCGICEKSCPVPGAAIHPNLAPEQQMEADRCIACYCCHEFCPQHAIELPQTWLARRLTALADRTARLMGITGN